MKCLHVAVAVLSLLSVGQSAPVRSCESLLQRVEISKETVRHFSLASHNRVFSACLIFLFKLKTKKTTHNHLSSYATEGDTSVSAAGQVDVHRRKHKHPCIQAADKDVGGQRNGENQCY